MFVEKRTQRDAKSETYFYCIALAQQVLGNLAELIEKIVSLKYQFILLEIKNHYQSRVTEPCFAVIDFCSLIIKAYLV